MIKSKPPSKPNRSIDWPAVKTDYLQGRSVEAIAKRFALGVSTVYRHAQRYGWSRTDVSDLPVLELARLRALAAKLRQRLEVLIDDGAYIQGGEVKGARENPANLLFKLCQITEKIITMESRVAGADGPTATRLSEQDHEILERFKARHGQG